MKALVLSLTSSIFSNKPFFNKRFFVEGGEGGGGWFSKSEWKKTRGVERSSLKKIPDFLNSKQIRFPHIKLLSSWWKFYQKDIYIFLKLFFIYEHKYIYVALSYMYLFKKNCHLICWVYKKNHFLSFHSSIFDLKIHKHPACKMNRYEQGWAGRKSEVLNKHTFLMTPKSFCWN